MSISYSPAWPHGPITQLFPNIFFVKGTNKTNHDGVDFQFSRNMIILKDGNHLILINSVRLTEEGLSQLSALGEVTDIIRIGAFHGRDDAFYRDTYKAKLWGLKGMDYLGSGSPDQELDINGELPIKDMKLFVFKTSCHPEAALLLNQDGGILITCDSIQNWEKVDEFFSKECGEKFQKEGLIQSPNISPVFREACQVKKSDYERLVQLEFNHFIGAHGEPIFNDASNKIRELINKTFG